MADSCPQQSCQHLSPVGRLQVLARLLYRYRLIFVALNGKVTGKVARLPSDFRLVFLAQDNPETAIVQESEIACAYASYKSYYGTTEYPAISYIKYLKKRKLMCDIKFNLPLTVLSDNDEIIIAQLAESDQFDLTQLELRKMCFYFIWSDDDNLIFSVVCPSDTVVQTLARDPNVLNKLGSVCPLLLSDIVTSSLVPWFWMSELTPLSFLRVVETWDPPQLSSVFAALTRYIARAIQENYLACVPLDIVRWV